MTSGASGASSLVNALLMRSTPPFPCGAWRATPQSSGRDSVSVPPIFGDGAKNLSIRPPRSDILLMGSPPREGHDEEAPIRVQPLSARHPRQRREYPRT